MARDLRDDDDARVSLLINEFAVGAFAASVPQYRQDEPDVIGVHEHVGIVTRATAGDVGQLPNPRHVSLRPVDRAASPRGEISIRDVHGENATRSEQRERPTYDGQAPGLDHSDLYSANIYASYNQYYCDYYNPCDQTPSSTLFNGWVNGFDLSSWTHNTVAKSPIEVAAWGNYYASGR